MKFDTPATTNPIDQLKVIGKPLDRIDGPLKTTGTAPYAHDRHDVVPNQAHGYILGAAIAKGRIVSMDLAAATAAPGVITIVTARNAGKLVKGDFNTALLLGGPQIQHYHQAVALIVAETFEQARAAAHLVRVEYVHAKGAYDLKAGQKTSKSADSNGAPGDTAVGDFDGAFTHSAKTHSLPGKARCPSESSRGLVAGPVRPTTIPLVLHSLPVRTPYAVARLRRVLQNRFGSESLPLPTAAR